MKKLTTFTAAVTLVVLVRSAPSSRNSSPQAVVDQKQTGDYNIQLHLKDFQIIALLAGDGGLGDYDYNYDYDFTFKPSTSKPSPSTSPSSSSSFPSSIPTSTEPPYMTQKPTADTPKPPSSYPTTSPSPSKPPTNANLPEQNPVKPEPSTSKPDISTIKPDESTSKLEPSTSKPLQEIPQVASEEKPLNNQVKDKETVLPSSVSVEKLEDVISPGKIKVQIIGAPTGSLGPVPGEEFNVGQTNDANAISQGSPVLHTRKCGSGFTRDQKGRCRRVRKPSSSLFGFSRLANNLASRFVKDASHSVSVESSEEN